MKAAAYSFRERAREALKQFCTEKDAGLLSAVLLGDKTQMDEEINDLYQKNGIAHLLAVSGLHVSLIGMGLYRLLRRLGLGFGWAGVWSGGLLFLYGTMTGFGPSVFRACLMLACSFAASYLGRTYVFCPPCLWQRSACLLKIPLLFLPAPFSSPLEQCLPLAGLEKSCLTVWSAKRNGKTLWP